MLVMANPASSAAEPWNVNRRVGVELGEGAAGPGAVVVTAGVVAVVVEATGGAGCAGRGCGPRRISSSDRR